MSYTGLLRMRCRILELTQGQQDGVTFEKWETVSENERCFLDLGFIRAGKDPVWTPDTKTAQNRSGVLFLARKTLAIPGSRVQITKGPPGTFLIDSSIDEAWTPTKHHHLECFVVEVDRVLAGQNGE